MRGDGLSFRQFRGPFRAAASPPVAAPTDADMKRTWTTLFALAGLIAGPAAAQDDWDLGRDPERNLTIAAVTFENFGVAVRCMDDVLSVVLSGLPPGRGVRTLRYQMGGQPEADTRWVAASDRSSAFAVWPAAMAADMARGGRLNLGVRDGDGLKRLSVDLPASPAAVGQVFQACGRELSPTSRDDEPDGENLGGLRWVRVPTPSFPRQTSAGSGLAAITCTVATGGGLRACRIESEFPEGGGFGRAATLGAHREARVGPTPGGTIELGGQEVNFVVRYNLIDELPLPTIPSRLPDRPERYGDAPADAD